MENFNDLLVFEEFSESFFVAFNFDEVNEPALFGGADLEEGCDRVVGLGPFEFGVDSDSRLVFDCFQDLKEFVELSDVLHVKAWALGLKKRKPPGGGFFVVDLSEGA